MKKSISPWLLGLAAILFGSVHLSKPAVDGMRAFTIASLIPFWSQTSCFQKYWQDRPIFRKAPFEMKGEMKASLRTDALVDWALSQAEKGPDWQRSEETVFVPVICRDPTSWSSCLWIQAGEGVVEKNGAVLSQGALLGVIDFVGPKTSRVRLITDSSCHIAVQVARGKLASQRLLNVMDHLRKLLGFSESAFFSLEEKEFVLGQLTLLEERLKSEKAEQYLAKGEIFGSCEPLWRAKKNILKGVGFSMEGEETALLSNVPFLQETDSLLQEGDLLVTSGLDSVFPPGLPVGYIDFVAPPLEGSFAYEIKAIPAAFNLNQLQVVEVLKSLSH